MVYTDRQRELIRVELKAFYELHHVGPRRASWGGICDEIFTCTYAHVRSEVLRQWVTGFVQKGRKQPLGPNAEELEAIASFLMHPDTGMLSDEELEDPETPYRFLRSFHEFLHCNPNIGISGPSEALNGVYEAWYKAEEIVDDEEQWSRRILTLEVDQKSRGLHATERSEIHFRGADGVSIFNGGPDREGWGIETTQGGLILFMKQKPNGRHYSCYVTIATDPKLTDFGVIRHLALLVLGRPVICDPTSKTLELLISEANTGFVTFTKIEEPDQKT